MIASHQGSHEFILIGSIHQCFDELLGWELEKFRHFRNAFFAGRRNLLELGWALAEIAARACALISAFCTLAAYSHLLQLTMASSPDSASTWNSWIGSRQWRLCPLPPRETANRSEKRFFYRFGTCSRIHVGSPPLDVKAIGILHDELATPHQTKPGPDFIAEFRLNLVQIEGQLAVGAHDPTHQVGDHFLVRRTQAKVPLVTVFEPDEFLAVNEPATALLPQFCGTGDRKKKLLRPARSISSRTMASIFRMTFSDNGR